MEPYDILQYCIENLEDTVLVESWGEKGIYYNPGRVLKRGVYILPVKEKNGGNDKSSGLDRPDTDRVNLGVRRNTFIRLFKTIPKRPVKGGIVDMDYDFTAPDTIMSHPVYGWMSWICALNPSEETFEQLKPYIQESYEYAVEKFNRKNGK